jgi:hypothetical protein
MILDGKKEYNDSIDHLIGVMDSLATEKKAGFDESQQRNSDGTWGSGGGPVSDPKYPGDPRSKKCFNRWFEGSKMVDPEGDPKEYFHGTTHEFEEFKRGRGNIENDFGIGHYFTSEMDDVVSNYRAEGPDLKNRIDRLAEQINYDSDFDYDSDDFKSVEDIARDRLRGGVQKVIPVYLNIKNPMILGGDNETQFQYEFDYETEEETGNMVNFVENLREASWGYNEVDIDQVVSDAFQSIERGGGGATNVMRAIRGSNGLMYASNDEGQVVGNEILRSAIENAGFDGIVDNNVKEKFRNMDGLYSDTQHVIAFEPGQIKGADNDTYCDDVNFTKNSLESFVENVKAGFDASQERNPDGTWGDQGGSTSTPEGFRIQKLLIKRGT